MHAFRMVLMLSLCFSGFVLADEAVVDSSHPDSELLPDPLSPSVQANKKEGSYLTGVPAVAFSPDSGFIYGAVLFHFDNGPKTDKRFAYTPYLRKTSLLAVQSTKGLNQVKLDFDLPNLSSSVYRVKVDTEFTRNISEPYYGVGEDTLEDSVYPATIATELGTINAESFSKYVEKTQEKRPDGTTFFRYNTYIQTFTTVGLSVERPFFSKHLIGSAGLSVGHTAIDDYTGDEVTALEDDKETTATMNESKLYEDEKAGRVVGFGGGATNTVRFAVRYDSRDFEPDPRTGYVAQLTAAISRESIGSSFDYEEYSFLQKRYASPFEWLTLALQGQYAWMEGEVPFYSLRSLGGRLSLKGHRINRFKSRAAVNINTETRLRVFSLSGGGQSFEFLPILFMDTGRVFDETMRLSSNDWRRGAGTGVRIVWNQATVIGIEYAIAGEEPSLYVNINHIF